MRRKPKVDGEAPQPPIPAQYTTPETPTAPSGKQPVVHRDSTGIRISGEGPSARILDGTWAGNTLGDLLATADGRSYLSYIFTDASPSLRKAIRQTFEES